MRSIEPFTIPSFVMTSSSALASTSTRALPIATTSVVGASLTRQSSLGPAAGRARPGANRAGATAVAPRPPMRSLRHGLPGAQRDGDTRGRVGRGRPRRQAVVVDRAQAATLGRGAAVQRRALHERAAERLDDRAEHHVVSLLTVARARRPGDVLVHQGAAEVV